MTNQIPVISTSRNVANTDKKSSSLIGRGLIAVQRKETGLTLSEQDARYRQARDIYNRITDYGEQSRFNVELLPKQSEPIENPQLLQLQPFFTMLQELADVFIVFQELADAGYGKAYFPLANIYRGGQGIISNMDKADHYSRMAFDWCFANRALENPEIKMDLGVMYHFGCGVAQNDANASFWLCNLAKQGYAVAQYYEGLMEYIGRENENDDAQAVFWYSESAEQGYARAQCRLGEMYRSGYGVEQDREPVFWHLDNEHLEQAIFWYREAAEQGHADAQFDLGEMYEDPLGGIDIDYEQAAFWYRKAAEQGHGYAQRNLGNMYASGSGVEKDIELAMFWYHKTAEQGNSDVQLSLGEMYEKGCGIEQDDELAFYWYLQAAERGDRQAISCVANYSWSGFGFPEGDDLAFDWYIEQAKAGKVWAQSFLADAYTNGLGIEADFYEGEYWCHKAAEQGDSMAQYGLITFAQNDEQIDFLYKAAESGLVEAQDALGMMLFFGQGVVVRNAKQSAFWLCKAANQGHISAQNHLTNLGINWKNK